jgi:hypothetical protein
VIWEDVPENVEPTPIEEQEPEENKPASKPVPDTSSTNSYLKEYGEYSLSD